MSTMIRRFVTLQPRGILILTVTSIVFVVVQSLAHSTYSATCCIKMPLILARSSTVLFSKKMRINHELQSRRAAIARSLRIASMAGLSSSLPLAAIAQNKPFAPTEALLPAARVKLTIDREIELVRRIISSMGKANLIDMEALQELQNLMLKPQNYVQSLALKGIPSKPAAQYLESYKAMPGDLPLQVLLIKNGDVSTWKDLKRKEKKEENTNEIRAAMNAYTDVLSFSGNSYVLNVDKATQSRMVRDDRLPELKQVVTSDMGMRYLYRNQVLTAMDDARAELEYQLSSHDQFSVEDLLVLLLEAQRSCEQWFSLIEPSEAQEAIDIISREIGMEE